MQRTKLGEKWLRYDTHNMAYDEKKEEEKKEEEERVSQISVVQTDNAT